jgi:hypothetical protein
MEWNDDLRASFEAPFAEGHVNYAGGMYPSKAHVNKRINIQHGHKTRLREFDWGLRVGTAGHPFIQSDGRGPLS